MIKLCKSLAALGLGAAMLVASPASALTVYNFYDGAAVVGTLAVDDAGNICEFNGRTTNTYVIVYSAPGQGCW